MLHVDYATCCRTNSESGTRRNQPEVTACYNPRVMRSKNRRWVEGILCVWIVGAQVWYYLQFRELFRPILAVVLHKLWH